MASKTRQIEVDSATADALETQARARGISLRAFLAELAWDQDLEEMKKAGQGPWSPEAIAEDMREAAEFERTGEAVPLEEAEAWVKSWGTANELPEPKPRKL